MRGRNQVGHVRAGAAVEPFAFWTVFPAALPAGGTVLTQTLQMLNMRYVVVSEESRWQIVGGGRRFPDTYPSKTLAVCSAIAFAEKDGLAGRHAEVMVRHENGLFITEWVFGEDVHAAQGTAPMLLTGCEQTPVGRQTTTP